MQKITPVLWFESDALAIARYYKNIFGNEVQIDNGIDLEGTPSGNVQVIPITIAGLQFQIMAAGKHDKFNDSISFQYPCKDQVEIDRLWTALTKDGGQEQPCGWCIDKYGLRWQIVPANLGTYTNTPAGMQALLKMKKIVIADLEKAASTK